MKGGVSEFFDADIHGLESIGDAVYRVRADAVNGPTEMEEGAENVFWATERAFLYAGAAIAENTGFALADLLQPGFLEALLFSFVVLVLDGSIGGAAGGIIVGLLSAGSGTSFGVATASNAGENLELAILDWLGVAFLLPYVAPNLFVALSPVRRGISLAWVAGRNPLHSKIADQEAAARVLSKASGAFFAVLLRGIVLYVMHEVGTNVPNQVVSSATYTEVMTSLLAKLNQSKLGAAFANFVQDNFPKILENAVQSKRAESPLNL